MATMMKKYFRSVFSVIWSILLVFMKLNVAGQDPSSATPSDITITEETQSTDNNTTVSPSTDLPTSPGNIATTTRSTSSTQANSTDTPGFPRPCPDIPDNVPCDDLEAECLECDVNENCTYGKEYNVTCRPKAGIRCLGNDVIQRKFRCRYCYQTENYEQECTPAMTTDQGYRCRVNASPQQIVTVTCKVKDVVCLGNREFKRRKPCNWTSGHKYSTALIFSITLGGFGGDRFYLGYWREGLGKLFSFGGIGVWTLVDVILIAVGYIGPADGSHYI